MRWTNPGWAFHCWSIYIDEQNAPQFPFGYGLSYTELSYDKLTVESPAVGLDGELVVSALITNVDTVTGEQIVQLYLRDLVDEVTRPARELKGFEKLSLEPGQFMV